MYGDLFDEKHKMRSFSPYEMSKGIGYVKKPSSGEYEGNILCAKCENERLSKLENYAKKALYGGGELPLGEKPTCINYISQDNVCFSICDNISYHKFKLFLLSILWRADISKRSFFSQIKIGPHYEMIRRMIREEDPGKADSYPVFIMSYANDARMPKDLIAQPKRIRTKSGYNAYVFIIGGLIYIFYVNSKSHRLPNHVISETIRPENKMNITHIPKGSGWDFIYRYCGLKK